jgi:hypothetical protein
MKGAVRRSVEVKEAIGFQDAQNLIENQPEHFRMFKAGNAYSDIDRIGSIRVSYAVACVLEQSMNTGGAHGPSLLSGVADRDR